MPGLIKMSWHVSGDVKSPPGPRRMLTLRPQELAWLWPLKRTIQLGGFLLMVVWAWRHFVQLQLIFYQRAGQIRICPVDNWQANQGPDPAEDCERSGGLFLDRIIAELLSGFLVNKILQAIFVRFSLRNVELSHLQLFLTWFSLAFMTSFYGSYNLHLS